MLLPSQLWYEAKTLGINYHDKPRITLTCKLLVQMNKCLSAVGSTASVGWSSSHDGLVWHTEVEVEGYAWHVTGYVDSVVNVLKRLDKEILNATTQ